MGYERREFSEISSTFAMASQYLSMDKERVEYYYGELKRFYLKNDSDWSDKAKSFRTIANNFYNELTSREGTFSSALHEFYRGNNRDIVSVLAFRLKDELNDIVHNNIQIDRERLVLYYNTLVRLIYIATGVLPDDEILGHIGISAQHGIFDGLNEQQKDAVNCRAKRIYVCAGPGTGKTHLLVNKLLWYISSSSQKEKIVALSFTNTASNELGARFRRKILEARIDKDYDFFNGTIHSFCFRMLKSYAASLGESFNYVIIDDKELKELKAEVGSVPIPDGGSLLSRLLRRKYEEPDGQNAFETVEELKLYYRLITIPEILEMFLKRIKDDNNFAQWAGEQMTVLVVDEAQDLCEDNFKIFGSLINANPKLKLFFVGDPRQGIFTFAKASYKYLVEFLAALDNYETKVLSGTYRCPQCVANYVNRFKFTDCANPPLSSFSDISGNIGLDSYKDMEAEADAVVEKILSEGGPLLNTAVLCCATKYFCNLVYSLNKKGVPFRVFGGNSEVKTHIRIFNHILKVIKSDNDYSLSRVARCFNLKNATKHDFYRAPVGKMIASVKNLVDGGGVSFHDVVEHVVSWLSSVQDCSNVMRDDYSKLMELSLQYSGIDEYLEAFVIDKASFSSFYENVLPDSLVPVGPDYLTLSTIHSAKGLEWKNVFIIGMSDENFPNTYWANQQLTEEKKAEYFNDKLKLMYVAATRTKSSLYLSYVWRDIRGYAQTPSRYLDYLK